MTVAAVSGVATFSTLAINNVKAGSGFTLTAADGGLSSGASSTFTITAGAASQVVFSVQPTTTAAGATISPAVTVAVEDSSGNVVTSDTSMVTVALGSNPGSGTLGGSVTVAAVSGVATFSTLAINTRRPGLHPDGGGRRPGGGASRTFTITRARPARSCLRSSRATTAGAPINHSRRGGGGVEDSSGNVVTAPLLRGDCARSAATRAAALGGTLTRWRRSAAWRPSTVWRSTSQVPATP